MATVIRLQRAGAKKKPYYRMVAADKRSPRDGKFLEKLGIYNPLLAADAKSKFEFKKDRVQYWLSTGAEPSEKVALLLSKNGFDTTKNTTIATTLDRRKKSIADRQKMLAAQAAKKAAEEAAKAAEEAAKVAEATQPAA